MKTTTTQFRSDLLSRPAGLCRWFASILLLQVSLGVSGLAAGFDARLGWTNSPGGVDVSWTSQSLTPAAPFVHYEFQVQHSADLNDWTNGVSIPGGFLGSASVRRAFTLPVTNARGFVRLSYRLNMPGANLSGLDLSGADLRGANLAGANLSGARLDGALLGGADLAGANLAGTMFAGANMQDVSLNGFDLAGLDLSTILGMPVLTQVTADPAGKAADLVPHLPYNANPREYAADDASVPGMVSTRNAMVMLETNVTVGQLNALLARHGAAMVAARPKDASLPNAVLMARLPATNALDLYARTIALEAEPEVVASAPDVLLGLAEIPIATGTASGWNWDVAEAPAGGNWGLERARVPQMWNLVSGLETRGVTNVSTWILDVDFPDHEDVSFNNVFGPVTPGTNNHGIHVAGIAGATRDNGKGIDGVNPFISMTARGHVTAAGDEKNVNLGLVLQGFDPGRSANGYRMVMDTRNVLSAVPGPRIVNISLAFNWYAKTNWARPRFDSPFSVLDLASISAIAGQYGRLMAGVAAAAPEVLIVCAAGNDYGLIPASDASPMANAALLRGAANIVVVEAHGINGARADFSNSGGHVAAPGVDILSAAGSNGTGYGTKNGTSMASPFVTGVAGFLLAIASDLQPPALINLIRKNGTNVDAFTSMMEIDLLPGHDRQVLKLLLDVDDGSTDGSRRVWVPEAALGQDRSFKEVSGPDFTDDDHVVGDGLIDMSDFRRWRDWLLHGEGNNSLNGSSGHLKFDGNGDGVVSVVRDRDFYPRGDFNGDGKIDRNTLYPVPGYFGGVVYSDLEVLMTSILWEDPDYRDELVLSDLIDSVDFHVSATNFFRLNPDIGEEQPLAAYDADTHEQPIPGSGGGIVSPDVTEQVLTVPTGRKYYVASDPIEIGEGTKVQMRSIGEVNVPLNKRGADYAVDLTFWEMTAVADALNPKLHVIDSDPNAEKVDAHADGLASEVTEQSTGARAWANRSGTIYSLARGSSEDFIPSPDPTQGKNFNSSVRWQRSFIKEANQPDPTFLVNPVFLRLNGGSVFGTELNAYAEIAIEMRAHDLSADWQSVFFFRAEIAGTANGLGEFRLVTQEGDLPPAPMILFNRVLVGPGYIGAEYVQQKYQGTIDLSGIPNGHSFEVRYRLNTRSIGIAPIENEATASLGDPLKYGSGIRMEYGDFGELPRIKKVTAATSGGGAVGFQAAAQPPALIEYRSLTNFYYRLYRGADSDTTGLPFAMKLGIGGDDSMIDPAPPVNPTTDDYTLENQILNQSLDLDGDGIDDVYELRRPSVLNPLDPADAFLDPDGDGRSNYGEYLDGTDPAVPDAPTPTSNPVLSFPGIVIPNYSTGRLIDINNDGVLDSAWPGLSVALGHLGGAFATPVVSPTTGLRLISGNAYVKLDGDAYPDAVLTDALTNRVFLFRGVGNGTFTPLTNYPAINGPSRIVLCNLNADNLPDIALFSVSGRGADLHINNGNGTLARLATLTTNAFGAAGALALGDFNGDRQDDVVVGYAANAVVFLSQPGGGYGPGRPYPVGSSPAYIAVGDLNGDGLPDIVTANRSSVDLSVLIAAPGGTFLPQVRYPMGGPSGVGPQDLRLADLNGDSRLDAVVARSGRDFLTVFTGQSGGTLAAPYTVAVGDTLSDIIDWNADGKLDLVGYIFGTGGLVSLGNGDGTFDTRLQIFPTNTPPTQVSPVDLNGDGRLELAGLNTVANSIEVWEHAAVTGTNRLLSSFAVGPWVTSYAPGDFNGDGLVNLAVTTQTNSFNPRGSNQVVILTNSGNGTFADAGHYPLDLRPTLLAPGDFNGDGHFNLAIHIGGGTLNGGSKLVSLLGNGSGGFQTGRSAVVGDTVSSITPANADADSRSELVVRGSHIVGAETVNFLEVFAVDAGADWTRRQTLVFANPLASLQVVSLNGDAYPDLAVTQNDRFTGQASLRIFPGSPAGFGVEQVLADAIGFSSFSSLADLNGDGLLDAAVGNALFLAKPGGGFHPAQSIWIGAGGVQGVADFNRDGKPDLMNGLSILLQK